MIDLPGDLPVKPRLVIDLADDGKKTVKVELYDHSKKKLNFSQMLYDE